MKKFKKILLVLTSFAVVASSVLFSGCNVGAPKEENQSGNKTSSLLSGFSSVRELQSFGYNAAFYKAALNTDERYVTEGETSAKFTFKGRDIYSPNLQIFSDSGYFGDKDFTKANMITLDVFNPDEKPHTFYMYFSTSKDGNKSVYQNYTEKTITVPSGHTLVTYDIDRTIASAICDLQHVEYFNFRFVNEAEEYSLYLDNLKVFYTEEEINVEPKKYEKDEILFFDNMLDRFSVSTMTYMCTSVVLPEISICRDPRYIYQGTGSLKVKYANESGNMNMDETPCLKISGEAVSRLDFSQYSKLTFKYMSEFDGGSLSLRIFNSLGSGIMFSPVTMVKSVKGEWMTMEIDLSKAMNGYVSDYDGYYNAGIDIEHISAIEIFYVHRGHEGQSFYLDEIKLEK